jgi:hypothetical protein
MPNAPTIDQVTYPLTVSIAEGSTLMTALWNEVRRLDRLRDDPETVGGRRAAVEHQLEKTKALLGRVEQTHIARGGGAEEPAVSP